MYTIILSKHILYDLYVNKLFSTRKVAKEIGCCKGTIIYYLKKYNIKRRDRSTAARPLNLDETILYALYITYKWSSTKIAKKFNCNLVTVLRYLAKYNIPIRTMSEIRANDSEEARRKFSQSRLGTHRSVETRRKISIGLGGDGVLKKRVYPDVFNKALKSKIFKRDNYTCQICKKHGGILNCHHIDYNKQNCEEGNLITLCVSCHMKTNFHRLVWKSYFNKILKVRKR